MLSWPVVLLVAVLLLRKQLGFLLPQLSHVRWKNFELHFDNKLREAKAEAERLRRVVQGTAIGDEEANELSFLSTNSPRAAILGGWQAVEIATLTLAASKGILGPERPEISSSAAARILLENHIISQGTLKVFELLRLARNRVAHEPRYEPSPGKTKNYVELALKLRDHLNILMKRK